ncbi:ABC transporter ATP-binding protein [Adlercreutzia sp. ZJ242]|uniref:ABC transporter ATP-binding protein n=1 Tax=Adlercreutzia sp. ZJ242 TaxID=2709409 RepID=UPI0013E9A40E|nr:ABC transporter ATP-binding protein [Adlercreutzia sp. ZJ242]
MPSIVFKDVTYSYVNNGESFPALEDVNLEIGEGEFLCLVGHSGCGKSTMLSLIAGLARPTRGKVLVGGEPVVGPGPDRSIVFQSYSLFPWQTALRNVTFAIRKTDRKATKEQARARALELLEQVGVGEAADRYPFQLSGGMRQRVAIARALAVDAPTMLLDEPFGALDPMIRRKLQLLLLDLWKGACCKTAVFVTHDIDEALILADRIVFMEPRHVVRSFELPRDRSRDPEALVSDPVVRAVKDEVLALFEATATGGEDA